VDVAASIDHPDAGSVCHVGDAASIGDWALAASTTAGRCCWCHGARLSIWGQIDLRGACLDKQGGII